MISARSRILLDRLHSEVLVADGAMGTALYARGFSYQSCFEELNESQPSVVEVLHREYIAAGAQIITTNTFGANRFRLSEHGFEKRAREINRAGAQIARLAAGEETYVAGSIGPLNRMLEPIGKLSLSDARQAFREQATGLIEGGVDVFVVETMSNIVEVREAFTAIRELSGDIPIIATMTFTEDGKTLVGDKPAEVRRMLLEFGADVIGANCSVGPQPMLDVIERMAGDDVPVAAQPNAGFPKLVGGRYIYLASPQYFAEYAVRFVHSGVGLVGGCCGTTSEHIRAIAAAVRGMKPVKTRSVVVHELEEDTAEAIARTPIPHSDFGADLGKRFMVSVEIDPPRSVNPEPFIRHAQSLKAHGVDLINVADSPLARSRMSALAMAHLIRREAGMDVLLHVSCRDRNALALQSELLGAHALGVLNILAVTGDPPAVGDYPFAKAVFELDSVGLAKMVTRMNGGKDLTGREMEEPTRFMLGVGVNPTSTELDLEYDRLRMKIDAGAQFAFTQPLFDAATLDRFLNDVAGFCKIPIFLGILPLRSSKHAEFIHNEIPDMHVPEPIREAMRNAGTEGTRVGVELAQKLLLETRSSVQGIYLMPPFNKFEMAVEILKVLKR
ncbi:bifunctional homocysteine S-methyltransferase/methylenetetrahydrofolate reductase [bacterium]|nr:bifunctional homocysteine S-methyltransferase/methylenetetrahydrofolate reductase [bacterium]MBU1984302.1 bifunctional homocysteine S-methyltransferase/methylenetetrahydrofolate reductase [bacterium]